MFGGTWGGGGKWEGATVFLAFRKKMFSFFFFSVFLLFCDGLA